MKTLKLNSFLNISILFLLYKLINTQPNNNNTMNIDNRINIDPINQNDNNNNNGQKEANSLYPRENKNNTNDDFNNRINILNNNNITSNTNQTLNNSNNNENNQEIPNKSSPNINNIQIGINVNPINVDDDNRKNITKENKFENMINNSSLNLSNQNEEIKENLQPIKKKKSRKMWYIFIFVLIACYIYYYKKKSDNDDVNYSQISKYSYYDF